KTAQPTLSPAGPAPPQDATGDLKNAKLYEQETKARDGGRDQKQRQGRRSEMKYSDFDKRKYAKWTDVVTPVVATVTDMRVEEMPRTREKALVIYFPEEQFRFGVPLTAKANREALAEITGSENPIDAIGTTLELFNDPTQRNPQTG